MAGAIYAGDALVAFVVGVLLVVGGSMGFLKKRSVPSLLAGATLGGSLLFAAKLISEDEQVLGYQLSILISSLVTAVMGLRSAATDN